MQLFTLLSFNAENGNKNKNKITFTAQFKAHSITSDKWKRFYQIWMPRMRHLKSRLVMLVEFMAFLALQHPQNEKKILQIDSNDNYLTVMEKENLIFHLQPSIKSNTILCCNLMLCPVFMAVVWPQVFVDNCEIKFSIEVNSSHNLVFVFIYGGNQDLYDSRKQWKMKIATIRSNNNFHHIFLRY